jgi:protease-4
MIRSMILDSYDWFIGLVEDRRPLTHAEVVAVADGSVFTGRQALEKKLIDELGGEKEAVAWLVSQGVDQKLKVIEWKPHGGGAASLLFGSSLGRIAGQVLGIPDTSDDLMRKIGAERLLLDGLVSLWHP